MKRNGDFEAADWEARGVKLDGRQARPANDVGRLDRSAERAAENRRRAARAALRQAFWAGADAARAGRDSGAADAHEELYAAADAHVEELYALWQEALSER